MFRAHKSSLDPAAMSAALKAFELAWAKDMAQSDGYDVPAARDLLARRIIEAALENGERNMRV